MKIPLKLYSRSVLLTALPLALELLILITLGVFNQQAEDRVRRVDQNRQILARATAMTKELYASANALAMYALTRSPQTEEFFNRSSLGVSEDLSELMREVGEQEDQRLALARVSLLADEYYAALERIKDRSGLQGVINLSAGELKKERVVTLIADMVTNLDSFAAAVSRAEPVTQEMVEESRFQVRMCLVAGVVVTVFFIVVSLWFYRGTSRRLLLLMDNAARLGKHDSLHPRLGGDDEISQVDKVFHDVAEALAEAARMKQHFVAVISHELRTPLTSIRAFLTMLGEGIYGEVQPDLKDRAISAERNSGRLILLINDLLDIEKAETGELPMEIGDCKIEDIIDESLEAVQDLSDEKNVPIDVQPTPVAIRADSNRIVQVVVNLLSNAIKFSPEGGRVTISTALMANGSTVEISVSDQGRGIPDHVRDAIFDRFRQVETSDATVKGGSGLGLAISKAIIEQHCGEIGVQSEVGKGSRFWLRLPVALAKTPRDI